MSTENVVRIWVLAGEAAAPPHEDLLALLAESDAARAERLLGSEGHTQFVTARAASRVVLGRVLGVAPRDVPIGIGKHGKPELTCGTVYFNVSHTQGLILVGVREAGPIGVDAETTRRRAPGAGMPRRTLAQSERRALAALSPAARRRAFLQAWSRKEAYAKGLGIGIGLDFRTIEVGWSAPALTGDPPWEVRSLSLRRPYVGAVAASGSGWHLHVEPHSW